MTPRWKYYWRPTPKKWRALGDGILGLGTTMTAWGIISSNMTLALVALFVGNGIKILTNFLTDEDDEAQKWKNMINGEKT